MANEKRLIDANAMDALENLDYDYAPVRDGCAWYRAADVWACIENEPTVDAVEVVRCKDCKHWKDGVNGCTDKVKCCEIGFYMIGENGYCVFGERGEENDGERAVLP